MIEYSVNLDAPSNNPGNTNWNSVENVFFDFLNASNKLNFNQLTF